MLEDRPVLKDRLLATATFGGIALATAMAIDFLVTGGFEMLPPPTPSHYIDPFAYAGVADARAETPSATTTAVAWNDPLLIEEQTDAPPPEDLVGDAEAQVGGGAVGPSEDDLYREIAALYASQDAQARAAEQRRADDAYVDESAYEDAEAQPYEEAPAQQDVIDTPEPKSPYALR